MPRQLGRMTTNANAISKIGSGSQRHSNAKEKNQSKEDAGTGYIPTTVIRWIVFPLLLFHIAGFVALCVLAIIFLDPERDISHYHGHSLPS